MTLVFSTDNSAPAIRQAILDRRTCVYYGDTLIGEEFLLRALFDSCVTIDKSRLKMTGRQRAFIKLANKSNFAFDLRLEKLNPEVQFDYELSLRPGSQNRLTVRGRKASMKLVEQVRVNYIVTNMMVAPGKPLVIPLPADLDIQPQ